MLKIIQPSKHASTAEIINQTHTMTVGTLETPVWGKPAKRGALLGYQREVTAA
jgi:hypothetical protein